MSDEFAVESRELETSVSMFFEAKAWSVES
jgi:hypothetical protein